MQKYYYAIITFLTESKLLSGRTDLRRRLPQAAGGNSPQPRLRRPADILCRRVRNVLCATRQEIRAHRDPTCGPRSRLPFHCIRQQGRLDACKNVFQMRGGKLPPGDFTLSFNFINALLYGDSCNQSLVGKKKNMGMFLKRCITFPVILCMCNMISRLLTTKCTKRGLFKLKFFVCSGSFIFFTPTAL